MLLHKLAPARTGWQDERMRKNLNRLFGTALLGLAAIALASCEQPRPDVTVDAGDPGPEGSATAIYASPMPQNPAPQTPAR